MAAVHWGQAAHALPLQLAPEPRKNAAGCPRRGWLAFCGQRRVSRGQRPGSTFNILSLKREAGGTMVTMVKGRIRNLRML